MFRRDVRSGEAETVVVRLDRLELSAALTAVLAPVRSVLLQLTAMLRDLDAVWWGCPIFNPDAFDSRQNTSRGVNLPCRMTAARTARTARTSPAESARQYFEAPIVGPIPAVGRVTFCGQ